MNIIIKIIKFPFKVIGWILLAPSRAEKLGEKHAKALKKMAGGED